MKSKLTKSLIYKEAISFCAEMNGQPIPELIGVTDGKAIGTFVEHAFKKRMQESFSFSYGNSASGIDLPDPLINTDIKVTYVNQPQSSCPYKSARQKIFGLGYNLLVMVYDRKKDSLGGLEFLNVTFVDEDETADYTTTKRLIEMIKDGANKEDIMAFLSDKNIPGDDVSYSQIADEILSGKVKQGYLTISNALQWRLQYSRVISLDNSVIGVANHDFKNQD